MKLAALSLLLAVTAFAQSPARRGQFIVGDNPADEFKLDNDLVHVVVDTELPFDKETQRERRRNRVLVYLDGGHFQLENVDGRIEDITVNAGDVNYSRAGVPYVIQNLSGHPIRIVEIELKTPAGGRSKSAELKLDPAAIEPDHFILESENPQIRVLRVHYNPHEKGQRHEHALDRVIVYLNNQGTFKEGDVRMAGAEAHADENNGDAPADHLEIEIK